MNIFVSSVQLKYKYMMPMLNIIAKQLADKTPAVNIKPEDFGGELTLVDAIILERGTVKGLTSVSFGMRDVNGKYYNAQTSAAIVNALVAAIRGAEARWLEIAKNRDNPDIFKNV